MKEQLHNSVWVRLLWILLMLLPIAVLFFLPGASLLSGGVLVWLLFPVCLWLMLWMMREPTQSTTTAQQDLGPRMLLESEQPAAIRQVMDVKIATEEPTGAQLFRGRLREPAVSAYASLTRVLDNRATALLQEDDDLGASILLVPKPTASIAEERHARPWVHWLLFILTIATTTWAGAAHQGVNLLLEPARFAAGLPYSLGLLAILGVHELGHYFAARYHGIRVTPPYFIPIPFALGTFGAFIQMRSPTENRKALFDVAAAGPLAGLVVAVPALLIGLQSSTIVAGGAGLETTAIGGTSAGSSILFALLAKLSFGNTLEYGHIVRLSPLAFAGWLGLLITGLNLLPIGQLDGGHISHALFGWRLGEKIGNIALWTLVLLAIFVWPGLMMWAIIVFFIAGKTVPPLNDLTPLSSDRRWLGYAIFVILGLILAPLPHSLWMAAGLHCPYL